MLGRRIKCMYQVVCQQQPLDTDFVIVLLKIPLQDTPFLIYTYIFLPSGNLDLGLSQVHLKGGRLCHLSQFTLLVSVTTVEHYLSPFDSHLLSSRFLTWLFLMHFSFIKRQMHDIVWSSSFQFSPTVFASNHLSSSMRLCPAAFSSSHLCTLAMIV